MQKNLRKFPVITLVFLTLMFLTILSSCSGSSSTLDQQNSASDQETGSTQTAQSESVTSAEQSTLSAVDTAASVDDLLGIWKGVNDDTQSAKVTKTDSGYQFEQNDEKYPATFSNGILKVKASDTDMADVYIDKQTGHLIVSYQGGITEYVK